MSDYEYPLWTILAIILVVLAAVWANIYYKSRTTEQSADREQDKENGMDAIAILQIAQAGRADSLHHKDEAGNQRRAGERDEQSVVRAIEPIEWWTGVLAVASVLAAIFCRIHSQYYTRPIE